MMAARPQAAGPMSVIQRVSTALPRRRILPAMLAIGLGVAAVTVGWVALYRVVPPPGTEST